MARKARARPKTGLSRGTPGYAINFFRSDILVNLQLDLKRLEKTGIDHEVCRRVRELLSALVSAASAEPSGSFWGKALHQVLRDYEVTYKKWNDVSGGDHVAVELRDRLLCDLQDIRHKISNTCRRNAHSLSEAHDLELVTAINDALIQVIAVVPNMFTALARSADRFSKRAMGEA